MSEGKLNMILLLTAVLAAGHIASAIPYEDNPRYFVKHQASNMVYSGQVLFVKLQSRNLILEPRTQCQALLKVGLRVSNRYAYIVFYSPPESPGITLAFRTTLTTSESPPHTFPNVVTYQTLPGGPYYPFKLMYSSRRTGCFILVFPHLQLGRACRLLQTSTTVRGEIPQECLAVYRSNCPRDDMRIFEPFCWDLIHSRLA